jgi:hypothetical protein
MPTETKHIHVERNTAAICTLTFTRHDGVVVSVSAHPEDLEFMAAEEESVGRVAVARELRALAGESAPNQSC